MQFVWQYPFNLALFLSAVALIYWLTFRPRGVPEIAKADPVELDYDRELWLRGHGYRFIGSYHINFGTTLRIVMNAHLSHDGFRACSIIKIQERLVTEFVSHCQPLFILCLNDFRGGDFTRYPTFKIVLHFQAKSIEELSAVYEMLLNECKRQRVTPVPLPLDEGTFAGLVARSTRRDFEYQVHMGLMKRISDNRYAPTLAGATVGSFTVWFHNITWFLRGLFLDKDQRVLSMLRTKLEEFWAYPHSDGDYEY